MDQIKIGKFIAELRKNKNLTQEQLGELLGVNNRTISRWETGKNMPDISLYKILCETLDISIEELINGERTNKSNIKHSMEKAIITTIDSSQKTKKNLNKIIKFLITLIFLTLITILLIIIYYNNKYPKIDIYNMNVINSDEQKLKEEIKKDNYKIYFYGIDSFQLIDINNNYFDLKTALSYKQTSINNIKKHLDYQYENGNIERNILLDGKTKIYKTKKFEAIFCNTQEGNKDIYLGTSNLSSNLSGKYCGNKIKEPCKFTRTYKVISIIDDDDYNYINVTLKQFQLETTLVRIKRNDQIKIGNNYEFTFITYEIFDDHIDSIFKYSELIDIKETNKLGLDQIQEKICINTP